jgi:hypothetical protein
MDENLGLGYTGSALEQKGHQPRIIPFNADRESLKTVEDVLAFNPDIAGLSMVSPGRAREFCRWSKSPASVFGSPTGPFRRTDPAAIPKISMPYPFP